MSGSVPCTVHHFFPDGSHLIVLTSSEPPSSSSKTKAGIYNSTFLHFHPNSPSQPLTTWSSTLISPSCAAYPTTPTPSSDHITIATSTPQSTVFTLYATLTWYFHLPRPPRTHPGSGNTLLRLNAASGIWGSSSDDVRPGAPRKPWCVGISFADPEYFEPAAASGLLTHLWGNDNITPWRAFQNSFWTFPYPSPSPSLLRGPISTVYGVTNNVRHPIRPPPPPPARAFYRRYVPALNSFLSFRLASLDDAELVNKWMNIPRVSEFWGEEGDISKTRQFLQSGLSKSHSWPVIGSWESLLSTEEVRDGISMRLKPSGVEEPFGYFEIYWVKEDILGRYADEVGDWERGVHVLVGEQKFRGAERLRAWLGGLVEFCFKDEARTGKVALEPRVDNVKFIKYLMEEGFYKEKEFAFPHKQAALMRIRRDAWAGPSV